MVIETTDDAANRHLFISENASNDHFESGANHASVRI